MKDLSALQLQELADTSALGHKEGGHHLERQAGHGGSGPESPWTSGAWGQGSAAVDRNSLQLCVYIGSPSPAIYNPFQTEL